MPIGPPLRGPAGRNRRPGPPTPPRPIASPCITNPPAVTAGLRPLAAILALSGLLLLPRAGGAQPEAPDAEAAAKSGVSQEAIPRQEIQEADSSAVDSLSIPPAPAWKTAADSLPRPPGAWLPRVDWILHRPAEDLADRLLPLVSGPLYDLANAGHRQLLALDGVDPREAGLLLEGIDLGSRIDGLADLGLLKFGLSDPSRQDPWRRTVAGRPAGALELVPLRACADSIEVRVRWSDGFMGFVKTEVDARRPLLGGRAWLGTRQLFTGERVDGAHYRGNDFQWNWDRPLGSAWIFMLDQRVLRDRNQLLGTDEDERKLYQSLLRLRLRQRVSLLPFLVEGDVWKRSDLLAWLRNEELPERQELYHGRLGLRGGSGRGLWEANVDGEYQDLSSGSWAGKFREFRLSGSALRELPGRSAGDWSLKCGGSWGLNDDREGAAWDLGCRLGWRSLKFLGGVPGGGGEVAEHPKAEMVLHAGRRHPWPDQLYLLRSAGERGPFLNPWLRSSGQDLHPDHRLGRCTWFRQELGLDTGDSFAGRWRLRLWRLQLYDQPVESPVSDHWEWRPRDHAQIGEQLFWNLKVLHDWGLALSQAWFHDDEGLVSHEFPTLLLDGRLSWARRIFGRELDFRVSLGAHYEWGGVDSNGADLWQGPEIWLLARAQRRGFTIWWSLRNPLSQSLSRVEGARLLGHEEWLGISWNFIQ